MKLSLRRKYFHDNCVIGELCVDGRFECFTLEDSVRQIEDCPVEIWKVDGKTAIPYGVYDIELTYSPRFKEKMPLLKNVEGFSGVRIHAGNRAEDTEGCILVGDWKGEDYVSHSRDAYSVLLMKMLDAEKKGEGISIEIDNGGVCYERNI